MGAELHLDRFARAREHGARVVAVGRATGQGFLLPALVPALGACNEILRRLAESVDVIEGGIEAARLSNNPQALSLALMNPLLDGRLGGRRRARTGLRRGGARAREGARQPARRGRRELLAGTRAAGRR